MQAGLPPLAARDFILAPPQWLPASVMWMHPAWASWLQPIFEGKISSIVCIKK
jgi:hypothetical protein